MRTTFLLLKAASAERLDSYCEFIRSLHNRFGAQCWDIIYVADTGCEVKNLSEFADALSVSQLMDSPKQTRGQLCWHKQCVKRDSGTKR